MGQCGACVDSTLTWIGNNKTITFLGLCVFALVISTWTLAAINAELKDEMSRMDTTTPNPVTNPTTTEESTLATELTETASTEQPLITTEKQNENTLRLDPTILPLSYDLFIHPDLTPGNETGTFSGAVTIELDILEPAQEIILHSHELNIENVTFTSLSQPDIRILNYELVPSSEILKVLLNDVIEPGTGYYLDIKFNGIMRGKIVGLYRSTYKDEAGNDRRLKHL